jgi:hypothetical protein
MHLSARLVLPLALSLAACSDSAGSGGSGGGGGSPLEGGAPGSGGLSPESCATDPLETGLVAEQTGVSADIADCSILKWAAQYGEPDPMIIKAMIYGESQVRLRGHRLPEPPLWRPRRLDGGRGGLLWAHAGGAGVWTHR